MRAPASLTVIALLTVGAVTVATLAGCDTPAPEPTSSTRATAAPTGDGVLRVGTLFPTSGTFAFLAPAQTAGVALAVADINAAGGVGGAPVEVVARDSGDAGTSLAETSFAELVAGGSDVVIGPSSSVLAERLIPLAAQARIPLISPAATFPGPADVTGSHYFSRTIPEYGQQGYALANTVSANGPVKIAYLYVDDDLGKSVAKTLNAGAKARGSTVVFSRGFPANTTDFAKDFAEVASQAPDVVILGSAYSSLDLTKTLITQALATGYGAGKLWLTTQNTGDYSQTFPNGTLNGVNGVIEGIEPDDAFKARLKGIDGNLAAFRYAAEAYDATVLAALAAVSAGDDGGAAVAEALRGASSGGIKCTSFAECVDVLKTQSDIDYDGITGPLEMTDSGDVTLSTYGVYAYDGENRFAYQRSVTTG
jgi:branched-chain amino acid transport system substrate-binding protein